jgi:alpha-N-arabinofuranosidase
MKRLMLATAVLWAGAAQAQTPPATSLTIQGDKPGPRIERDIFGQFAEHLGTGVYGGVWVGKGSPIPNVRGIRSDVVAALKAIKVPNVRWPGGCYGDDYHWRHGVGSNRRATVNASWGGVVETNEFGTHEFMDFLDQIGAEAFLSINIGSGTVEEAADWLEYLTADIPTALAKERAANGHPKPYRIKYLGLGNENWGCGGAMSADHYVEEMKRYARYSRNFNPAQASLDNQPKSPNAMQRIAVGWDSQNSDYTEAVMQAWKSKVWSWDIEGVSLHSYTVPGGWPPRKASTGFGEADYAETISRTLLIDGQLAKQSAIMDKYDPEKKLTLSVDEWGAWLAPAPGSNPAFLQQQNSLRDAILAAINLNIFMRHADRVRVANIAQMVNVLQAMILTDGPKMVLTPTYHVFAMYLPFQDASFVPVQFDAGTYKHGAFSTPRVDAVAARGKDGKLWLALTNVDPNAPAEFVIADARGASGQLLTAAKVDSVNSFDAPDAVKPQPFRAVARGGKLTISLPAKSVAVVGVE